MTLHFKQKGNPVNKRKTARHVAAEVLSDVYTQRIPVTALFDKAANQHLVNPKDRRLGMQLLYGVLRNRLFLDEILGFLSNTPLKKLDPFVHQVIVIGLYQVFFLKRIPHSAAVNEAVNSCRRAGVPKRLHGFVNGVLREAIRKQESLKNELKERAGSTTTTNHPDWLVKRWQKNIGKEETSRVCRMNNKEPTLTIRVNLAKITRDSFLTQLQNAEITCGRGRYSPAAVTLPDYRGPVTHIPGYSTGLFQVQDEAAQLATYLLGPIKKGGRYLDACAGLGGKTSHLLQLAETDAEISTEEVEIHAVEPDHYRVKKLQENIARLSPAIQPKIHQKLLQHLSPGEYSFSGILLDAPCSGTGVIRRHPDIRWNRQEEDLSRYQQGQSQLISHAARLLKPGGVLVYTTCSLEPEENQQVIANFLAGHPEFQILDGAVALPEVARIFVKDKFYCPLPTQHIDGFFGARILRN